MLQCLCVCFRCEDMVDVRRLKMLQMVQLFKCEEDALQVGRKHTLQYSTYCIEEMVIYICICVRVRACVCSGC